METTLTAARIAPDETADGLAAKLDDTVAELCVANYELADTRAALADARNKIAVLKELLADAEDRVGIANRTVAALSFRRNEFADADKKVPPADRIVFILRGLRESHRLAEIVSKDAAEAFDARTDRIARAAMRHIAHAWALIESEKNKE